MKGWLVIVGLSLFSSYKSPALLRMLRGDTQQKRGPSNEEPLYAGGVPPEMEHPFVF